MATIAENLRLRGIKVSMSVRGVRLTLNGKGYTALVNTSDGPVDYYGDGNVQIRSEIHILRSDFGDSIPGGHSELIDSERGLKHVVTEPPNWQRGQLVVRFMCRVETT